MAARSARTARWGNIIAGVILMGFSLPFGLLGGFARKYHGPDSPYAEFAADTCSAPLGLPSCAQWVPDDKFVLFKYLWEFVPRVGAPGVGGAGRRSHAVQACCVHPGLPRPWCSISLAVRCAVTSLQASTDPGCTLGPHRLVHGLAVQILGGWTVLAILCASMSTATGAILATSTVMAHNIFRKVRTQQHPLRQQPAAYTMLVRRSGQRDSRLNQGRQARQPSCRP